MNLIKILWELYAVLFKVGLCTFGGGIAMLPILEKELVEKRGWTTSEELMDWFAIGQSTPGIIAVNVSTFVGHKRAGVIGGIAGTLGMVTPSIIIITVIAMFIGNFANLPAVISAMAGINVAVAAVLTQAVIKFSSKSVKSLFGVILFLISFVLIYFFGINTVWIILFSALTGIIIACGRGEVKKLPVIIAAILIAALAGFFIYKNHIAQPEAVSEISSELSVTDETVEPSAEYILSDEEIKENYPLWKLFFVFAYIGLITIGGGQVGITVMQQTIVEKFHLIGIEEFFNMVAVSESTPGPIGINIATYIGTKLYGVPGGIITTLGEVLPSIICIVIIARFFMKFAEKPAVKAAFSTLRPAVSGVIAVAAVRILVIALVAAGGFSICEPATWAEFSFKGMNTVFYLISLVAIMKTKVHPVFVILAGAVFGIFFCTI